jgi:hypothetical protein
MSIAGPAPIAWRGTSMDKHQNKKYVMLLEREKQFVRRVVYLIRAQTPRPWWHAFVPLTFLFEYLARKRDVRAFSDTHLYLKQIALSAASRDVETGDPRENDPHVQAQLRDYWLHMQKIESQEIFEHLSIWVDLLRQHYRRLLEVQGKNYTGLIRNAYASLDAYRTFLSDLTRVEKRMDHEMTRIQKENHAFSLYIQRKQKATENVRDRELREISGNSLW